MLPPRQRHCAVLFLAASHAWPGVFGKSVSHPDALDPKSLHTVFCAECTTYFDWKSAGVFHSHRTSGMPGKITRLLACSAEQRRHYPERGMKMGPTFVHENFANNPHNGEKSGSYNKPAAVMFWTQQAQIAETFVLYVDADMLLRAPLDPVAMGVRRGRVVSEHVGYLEQGIHNKLVANFVPAEAVPLARAAGWYHIFHVEDLRTISPRWLHYTEMMRSHPVQPCRSVTGYPSPNPVPLALALNPSLTRSATGR